MPLFYNKNILKDFKFKIMKWSIYNISDQTKEDKTLLYNYFTDKIIVLLPELYNIVKKYDSNADEIKNIHPELFSILCDNGFIVDNQVDEATEAEKRILKELSSKSTMHLTINPTLDCNLRCWYCYEEHTHNCYMTRKTMDSVVNFVKSKTCSKELKTICLSLFGGEPLLKAEKIALPLINEIKDVCTKREKTLIVHFTTNGVLLSKRIADLLASTNLDIHFQIPFDGGQVFHDKTKYTKNGKGTYQLIIKNIKYALSKGFSFTIRCNYTNENIDSYYELVDEINNMTPEKGKVKFFLQKVWQEKQTDELKEKAIRLKTYITGKDSTVKLTEKEVLKHCYGDFYSSAVINYNGDVFKCTARKFNTSDRIGILEEDGHISKTEKAKLYDMKGFVRRCHTCRLLPVCTICVQNRIDHGFCKNALTQEEADPQLRMRLKILTEDNIYC